MNGNNKWATTGLILGVLSIFFAPIGIIPILGIIINIVALIKAQKNNGAGKWQALIGLLLSALFFVVYLNRYGYITTQ